MARVNTDRSRLRRSVRCSVAFCAALGAAGLPSTAQAAPAHGASAAATFCKKIPTAALSSDFGTKGKLLASAPSDLGEYDCAFGKSLTDMQSQIGIGYNPHLPGTVAEHLEAIKHELGGFVAKPYASIGGTTYSWTATVTGVKESGMVSFKGLREYSVSVNKTLPLPALARMLGLVVGAA